MGSYFFTLLLFIVLLCKTGLLFNDFLACLYSDALEHCENNCNSLNSNVWKLIAALICQKYSLEIIVITKKYSGFIKFFWLEISPNNTSLYKYTLNMPRSEYKFWKNFNHKKTPNNLRITLKIVCLQTPPLLKKWHSSRKDYVFAFLNRGTNRATVVKNQVRNYSWKPLLGIKNDQVPYFFETILEIN